MKKLILLFVFTTAVLFATDVNYQEMLAAAKAGDEIARVVIAYSHYLGEYRDGTKVDQDLMKAYAWASLANYQGNQEAKKLVEAIIPKLSDRKKADDLAGEYFKQYGAKKDTARNPRK